MTNQYTELRDYFQTLAENYTPIGHSSSSASTKRFFENTMDEITNPPPGAIMYLSPLEFNFSEQDGSETIITNLRVSVLQNTKRGNHADMHTAIQNTYAHCKEIIAKIKADRNDPAFENRCLINTFDLDDIRLAVEGYIRDGWMGCTISFNLRISESFTITPELWP